MRQTDPGHCQWFAAGDTVQLSLAGSGFSIGAEAQALSPGLEGQDTRPGWRAGASSRPPGGRAPRGDAAVKKVAQPLDAGARAALGPEMGAALKFPARRPITWGNLRTWAHQGPWRVA